MTICDLCRASLTGCTGWCSSAFILSIPFILSTCRFSPGRRRPTSSARRSGLPFVQIDPVSLAPGRGPERAGAAVGKADRPRSQLESFPARAAAEIHVVEVKIEARIEAHPTRDEARLPGGEKDTVEQLARRGHRAVERDLAEGLRAVGDAAAQVAPVVRDELPVEPRPCRLVAHPAPVSRNADDVVRGEPLDDAIGQKIVVEPDVVVHEYQDGVAVRGRYALVVYLRQAAPVGED